MALRNLNSALKAALLKDDEFILAHLIKFEKPKQGSSTSTNAVDYVYMTDAPFPLTLDDQIYIPSNIMNIGMVRENIEAKASTMSIKLASSALGTSFVDDITFTASYIQIPDNWSVLGFKEGDVITFTPGSGTGHGNSDLEFRIDSISESAEGKEDRAQGTVVSGTLSTETKNYKVSTDNPQLNSLLIDRTSDGYATYIHREITVYRAYLDPQTGAYIGNADKELYDNDGEPISNPFILFKGNIANANLVENATSGSTVTWSITDHWGDFVRINGRQTSDASHRALDSSGRSVVEHLPNPLYEDDYAFEHAEKSLNAMATYIRQEQRTTKKWGKWAKKITGGKKTVTYWADVPVPVELNFNLAAKFIPVVYGMSKVKGNTFFIDTGKDDSTTTDIDENTYIYQAQALCEGPIAGIYDIHIQGDTVLCTDNVDYGRRQPEEDTEAGDELPTCYGNAKAGKILNGYTTISFSDADRYDILSTPEEDAELVNRSAKLDTKGLGRHRFFGGVDTPVNEPDNPTVLTSSAFRGVGANQSIRLLKPNEIIFDVFTGTSDQRGSDRLATISAEGGFKIQNDFYRGAEGNYSPYYWTTSHRALDTAYVVSRTTLAANASSLPEIEYVVKGKFINCFNYDGSLSPYEGESEISTWKRYDAVDVYDLNDNKLNSGVYRIAEIFDIDKVKAQQVRSSSQSGVGTQKRFLVHDTSRLLADIGEEKEVYFKKSGATEKVYCSTYRNSVKRGASSTITLTPVPSMTTSNFKNTARRRSGKSYIGGDSENSFTVTYSASSSNAAVGDEMASNSTQYYPITFKKPNSNSNFNTTIMCKSGTRTLSGGTYTHKIIVDYWPSAETFKKIKKHGGAAYFTNFVSAGSQNVSEIEAEQVLSLNIADKPDRVIRVEKVITTSSSNKVIQLNESAKRVENTSTVAAYEDDILNDLRVSLNPSIQLLDFLTSKRYGKGLDLDTDIDLDSFLQAARDCDERSEISIVVTGTRTPSSIGIGSLWKREYSNNVTFTGKVKRLTPIQFEGSSYTQIDFEDCTGKFVRRWKPYASYVVGDLVYDGHAIYRVNSAFAVGGSFDDTDSDSHDDLQSNSTEIWHEAEDESGNLTSASLSKITGSGSLSILYPYVEDDSTHKAQGPIANPVIRSWNGTDFSAPGYSLYDCDDIDYWALQGWNDANQYNVTRHQCSMNIDTSESLFETVNLMLKQFNGLLTYTNGKYSLSVKKAVPDTLDTIVVDNDTYTPAQIHKDDIIGELKIEGKAVKDTFNTVTTRVSDPAQKFNNTDITFFDSNYIEQDRGIPKSANIAYPGIINYYNARINIKQELDRSRAGLTVSFTTKPSAILLKAGDFIQLTHPEFGLTNKTFRITSLSLKSDGLVTIAAQEHDSSTYILKGLDRGTELIATNDSSGRLPARVGAPPVLATTTNNEGQTVLDLPNIVTSLPQQMIIKWSHADTYDPSTYAVEVWRHSSETNNVLANATKLGASHGTEFLDSHGQEDDGFNFYYYLRYIVTGTKVNASEPSRMYSDFTQVIEADMTPLNAENVKYTGTGTPTIQSLMPNEAGADNTTSQVNDGVTIDGAGGGFVLDENGHIKSNGRISEQVNSAGESGFFLGYNADAMEDENGVAQGAYTFGVGDQTNNLIWDGEELSVTGNIDATSMTLDSSIEIGRTNLDSTVTTQLDLAVSASQSTTGLALLLNQNAAGSANAGEASLVAVDGDGNARNDVDGFIEWNGDRVTVPHDSYQNTTILTDVAGKKGFIAFDVNKSKPFDLGSTYGKTSVAFVYKQGDQWYYDNNGNTVAGVVEWAPGTLMGTEAGTTSTPARILAIGYLQTKTASADSILKGGLFATPVDIDLASMPSDEINSGTIAGIKITHNSIESSNFSTGTQGNGFKIQSDGSMEASSGTFRGNLDASTLTLDESITIGASNLPSAIVSGAAAGATALEQAKEMQSNTDNLIVTPVFTEFNESQGDWTSTTTSVVELSEESNSVNFPNGYEYALKLTDTSVARAFEVGNIIPVLPGETMYFSVWVNTEFANQDVSIGYHKYTSGSATGIYVKAATLAHGTAGWKHLTGTVDLPNDSITAINPFAEIDWESGDNGTSGAAYFNGFRVSRSPQGNIGGITINSNKLYQGAGTFNDSGTGFYLDNGGNFSLQDKLNFDADGGDAEGEGKLTVKGDIEADSLTLASGISIGTGNLSSGVVDSLTKADNIPANQFAAQRTWGFDTGAQGWSPASNLAVQSQSGGYLLLTPSSSDPQFQSPDNLNLEGELNTVVMARIKRTGGTGWDGKLFYSTDSVGNYTGHSFSGDYRKDISDPTNGSTGTWVVAQWDMEDLTHGDDDWTDNIIKRIRLDFGLTVADTFLIDWVAVGNIGSASLRDGADLQSGTVGGITIEAQKLYQGEGNHNDDDTGFYLDNSGNFSIQDKLSFDGTDLTVSGDITAENLSISENATVTGTLSADNLSVGNLSLISADLGTITGGSLTIGENNEFAVTSAGALTATGATISGAITATSGTFTGTVNASSGTFTGNVNAESITISQPTTSTVPSGMNVPDGETTVVLTKNQDSNGSTNVGEIRMQSGYFRLARDLKRTVASDIRILSSYENSTTPPGNTFYVISGEGQAWGNNTDGDATNNGRFHGGSDNATINNSANIQGFFIAKYENSNWKAVNNNNASITFTPASTDYCIAVGTKSTTDTGTGIDTLVQTQRNGTFVLPDNTTDDINAGITIESGGITMSSGGFIKGGQSGFDTGSDGFFLGYDTDAYKFSIGDVDGDKLTWDGSDLAITGDITANSLGLVEGLTIGQTNLSSEPTKLGIVKRLNSDPFFAHAGGTDYWFNDSDLHDGGQNSVGVDSDADTTYKTDGSNLPTGKSTYLQVVDNDDDSDNFVNSQYFTIDSTKTYKITVWARQTAGNRKSYLLVDFRDSSNQKINNSSNPTATNDGSTGWLNIGTYHYYGVNGSVFGSDWTKYEVEFGNNVSSVTSPDGAVKFSVGGLLTRDAGAGVTGEETTVEICQYIVEEFDNNDTTNAAITELAGVTLTDKKLFLGAGTHNNSNTGFYLDNDGKFSLTDKLSFDGTNLSVSGAITATSGTFTGAVNASSGTFTGNVSTTAKFTAGNVGLDGTSGDTNTIRIYAGNSTPSDALFKVTDGGAVTATSGTIGSLTLASDKVTIGSSTTHGNADAKFYADNSGNFGLGNKLTFDGSALSINGAVTATSGSFGGITIADSKIYTGDGDFANSNTGFYLDNTGDFSLSDKFKFDISASTLTVDGTIEADGFSTIEGKPVPEITVGTKLQSQATLSPRVVIFGGDPVFYAALEDNTRVYLNGILVDTVNKGASSTIAAADLDNGDIIHSTKPVSLRQNGAPLPTFAATGQFFATGNRPDYTYLHFGIYSPYADGQIKYFNFDSIEPEDANNDSLIDWSDNNAYDASSNPNGWKTKALIQGSVAELTIERSSNTVNGFQWFQADTPVLISSAASTSNTWFGGDLRDVKLLKEVSREVLSYDEGNQIKYSPSNTGTIVNDNTGSSDWRYSKSTGDLLFAHTDQGDGDGSDGVQGIPWKMCGDTYVIDHGLRSYQIATIEPSVISAYYWTGSTWTLYKTHDFTTASRSSFASHSEGDSDAHGVDSSNFIGQADADKPWRFIGTGRFALRVNTPHDGTDGNDDDEYFVLGYDSNLRSQETIRVGQLIAADISADAITGEKILSTTNIKVGPSGSEQVGLDGSGSGDSAVRIYAGDTTPGSAPFRVTNDGSLTATDATISGAITATSLTIGGSATVSGTIPNANVDGLSDIATSGSASDLTGTIDSGNLPAGALNSNVTTTSLGLGTAATSDSDDFASATQGDTADSALQPDGNLTGSINDLPVGDSYKETTKGLQLPTANQVLPGAHDDEWTLGVVSGNRGIWGNNGGANENEIVFEQGPHGVKTRVWKSINEDINEPSQTPADDGDDGDGGFYNTTSFTIGSDDDAVFRFSLFIRQEDADGSMYVGGWNWDASGNNIALPKYDGSEPTDTNQYFFAGDLPTQGEWYLAVGYFQMNNDDDKNSGLSGLYQVSTGFKKQSWDDLMFNSNATKFSVRTYQYYANDTDDGTVARWAHPRVEKMRTNTPSIEQLIAGNTVVHTTSAEKALKTITSADGSTNITLTPNADIDDTTDHDPGEIKVSAGVYKFGDNDVREVATEATLATPFEGGTYPEFPGNNFYIISGNTGTVTYRVVVGGNPIGRFQTISGSNIGAGLFVAIFDPANEQWYAVNNSNEREAFTPLSTDHVVAIGHKTSIDSGSGFQTLRSLIPFVNDPDSDQTEPTLTAGVSITGGGVTINGGGSVKGGQTAYNNGTGFFLGYDTDNYKFSIGNSTANENSLTWDGSDLTIRGDITADSLTLANSITIGTGNLPDSALNENVTASSLNISNTDVSGLGSAATSNTGDFATGAEGDLATSASQVNAGLAFIPNKSLTNNPASDTSTLINAPGEALICGVDKNGNPAPGTDGFIQWEGNKITVERIQYTDVSTNGLSLLTHQANRKGFIIFDTAKGNDFSVNGVAMDIAFAWKIGTQWYYDKNNAASVHTFTPTDDYVALGYMETSTSDLILKGGLFGHPIPLEQAAFPGDVVQSGTIGGIKIDNEKIYAGTGTFNNANTGFYLKNDGDFSLKNKLKFDASESQLTIDGDVSIAGGLKASEITPHTLEVVNPPTLAGNINRWGGINEFGTDALADDLPTGCTNRSYSDTENALRMSSTGNTATYCDSWEIDHNAIYRIELKLKKNIADGAIYVGTRSSTTSFAGSTVSHNADSASSEVMLRWGPSRAAESSTYNQYFWSASDGGVPTSYKKMVFYAFGSNVDIDSVPDHYNEINYSHGVPYAQFPSTSLYGAVRFLNYFNSGTESHAYFKDVTVEKITPLDIQADNIRTTTLSAISSDLGSITGGSLAIGNNNEFQVTSAGVLTATGATISGAVSATSGSIADSVNIGVRDEDRFASKIGWNFESGKQGWTSDGDSNFTHNTGGYIVIDATDTDPVLFSPDGLNLDGNLNTKVLVSLRRTAGTGWHGALYYQTNGGHSHEESNKHLISDPTGGTTSSDWMVVEWDMSNQSSGSTWTGSNTVNQIRLDLGNTAADTFEVNWVAIGERGANALQEGANLQSGTVGGIKIDSEKLYAGAGNFFTSDTGFYLKNDGDFSLSNKLKFDESADTLTVNGNITAQSLSLASGITIGTANLPDDVLNDNVGPGGTHNKDPYFEKSSWFDNPSTTALGSVYSTNTIVTNATGLPTGRSTHFRSTDNDDNNEQFFSELMPITEGKLYKITVWAKQSGDRNNYLLVDFRNAAGQRINNGDIPTGQGTSAATTPIHNSIGWDGGVGNYSYWKVANADFASDWKKYEIIMGGDDTYTFSSGTDSNGRDRNPVEFRVGALVTRAGSNSSVVDIAEYTVTEIDADDYFAVNTSTINHNPDFKLRNIYGRPEGIKALYGNQYQSNIKYEDEYNSNNVVLKHSSDSSIGMGWPAMRLDTGVSYTITVRAKVTGSSNKSTGFYIRMQEYDGDLSTDKTHISAFSGISQVDGVQSPTRQLYTLRENASITTSFVDYTYEYTPTTTAKWGSLVLLNWTGMGTEGLVVEYARVTPNSLDKVRGSVGGISVTTDSIYAGAGNFANSNTGFYADSSGNFSLSDQLSFDGDDLVIQGNALVSGSVAGSALRSNTTIEAYQVDENNLIIDDTYAALDGEDDTFRIYAGSSIPDSAPFSVQKNGSVVARDLKLYTEAGELYFDSQQGFGVSALSQVAAYLGEKVHQFSKPFITGTGHGNTPAHTGGYADTSDYREWEKVTITENTDVTVTCKIDTGSWYGYASHTQYENLIGYRGSGYIYHMIGGWTQGTNGSGGSHGTNNLETGSWPTTNKTLSTSNFKVDSYGLAGTSSNFPTTTHRKSSPNSSQTSFYDNELIKLEFADLPPGTTTITGVTGAKLASGTNAETVEVFTSSNNIITPHGVNRTGTVYMRIQHSGSTKLAFTITTPAGYGNISYSNGKITTNQVDVLQQAYDAIPEFVYVTVNRRFSNGNSTSGRIRVIDKNIGGIYASGQGGTTTAMKLTKTSLRNATNVNYTPSAWEFCPVVEEKSGAIDTSWISNLDDYYDSDFGHTHGSGHVRLGIRTNAGLVDSSGNIVITAPATSETVSGASDDLYYDVQLSTSTPSPMDADWLVFPTVDSCVLTWSVPTTSAGFELEEGQATQADDVPANKLVYQNQDRIINTSNAVQVKNKDLHVEDDIKAQGDVTAFYSDERLKTRTGIIQGAIEKVKSLEGFYYTENSVAKSLGYKNDKVQVGLSAQQVESIMPEIVSRAPVDIDYDEDGNQISKTGENYLTLNYAKLVPLLVEAIKSQQDTIEELTERIDKLEK